MMRHQRSRPWAGEAIFAGLPLAGAGIWLAITVTCSSATFRS
jgi:hypothetical protein